MYPACASAGDRVIAKLLAIELCVSPFMMDRTSMFVEQSSEWEDFREGGGNHIEEGLT